MTKAMPHAGLRTVIAIIGNRNAGKSSLLNAITGQDVSIVSETLGTTTDPVGKPYELLPAGPVSLYDTAGLDDEGALGQQRVKASEEIINRADLVLVVVGKDGLKNGIETRMQQFNIKGIPFIPVFNFKDAAVLSKYDQAVMQLYDGIAVSAKTGEGISELKARMVELLTPLTVEPPLLSDLISKKDTVILVTPIDLAAPKGRLIMPQVQALREALDSNAVTLTVKETELKTALAALKTPPALVITDSQAIKEVAEIVPDTIPLTTFSMLFARYKGDFQTMLDGVKALDTLQNGDKILIAEGCSHHISCDDIGRVKIPNLIRAYTKKEFDFNFTSGLNFPEDLSSYALVIHCGGCILNRAEIRRRLRECALKNIKITNYGMLISKLKGVLPRVSAPLLPK